MSKIYRAEYFNGCASTSSNANQQAEELKDSINEKYGMGEGSLAVTEASSLDELGSNSVTCTFPMGQTIYNGPLPTV